MNGNLKKFAATGFAALIVAACMIAWLPSASPIRSLLYRRAEHRSADEEASAKMLEASNGADQTEALADGKAGALPSDAPDRSHDGYGSLSVHPSSAIGSTSVERNLLHGKNMNVSATQILLQSDRFAETVRELRMETVRDPLAVDLTNAVEQTMRQQIMDAKSNVQLQDFSCGTTICMSVLRSSDAAQFKSWMQAFLDDKAIPKHVVSDRVSDLGGGTYEDRFLFTTDPESNAAYDPHIQH